MGGFFVDRLALRKAGGHGLIRERAAGGFAGEAREKGVQRGAEVDADGLFSCRRAAEAGARMAPPPRASTAVLSAYFSTVFRSTCASSWRKAGSPSWAKMSGMLFPAFFTTRSSRSMKGQPRKSARTFPTVVFPLPMKPDNAIIIPGWI